MSNRSQACDFRTSVCLRAVRGFSLSISQSTSRLKLIAAVRAATMQNKIHPNTRNDGIPPAATAIELSANGRANTVCENLMNSASLER